MRVRRRSDLSWATILFLLQSISTGEAISVCSISLLGDAGDSASFGACSCREEGPGAFNVVRFPFTNAALAALCQPSIGNADDVTVVASFDLPEGATTLHFTGAGPFLLDGSLTTTFPGSTVPTATAVVAERLDLTANGANGGAPLLRFTGLTNLTLQNLVFRNLTVSATSGPLILLEDCYNVTIRNVTFEEITLVVPFSSSTGDVLSGTSVGGLVRVAPAPVPVPEDSGAAPPVTGSTMGHVVLDGLVLRRVAVVTRAQGEGEGSRSDGGGGGMGLLSIAGCRSGCVVRDVLLDNVSLDAGVYGVLVYDSSHVEVHGVHDAAAAAAAAVAAAVGSGTNSSSSSSGSSSMESGGDSGGSLLRLRSGAVAVGLSGCSPGCSVRGLSLLGAAVEDGARALQVELSSGVQVSDVLLSGVQVKQPVTSKAFGMAVRLAGCPNASFDGLTLTNVATSGNVFVAMITNSTGVTAHAVGIQAFTGSTDATSGAVYVRGGAEVTFHGMRCSDSTAWEAPCLRMAESTVAVVNGLFVRNSALEIGGAMRLDEGTRKTPTAVSVLDSTFVNNTCLESGGAIIMYPDAGFGITLQLRNTTFTGNAARRGGAVALVPRRGAIPSARIESCTFRGNVAKVFGPAPAPGQLPRSAFGADVYAVDGAVLGVSSSLFVGGTAVDAGSSGGCMYLQRARGSVATSNFSGCASPNRGGAIFHEPMDGANCPPDAPAACGLTLSRCRFERCSSGEGGAMAVPLNNNVRVALTVEDCDFVSNRAVTSGGAIAVPGNCMPYSDPARCAKQVDASQQLATQLRGSRFVNNSSPTAGAVYVAYHNAQGLNISGCTFDANNASEAGALFARGIPFVDIRSTVFTNQTAALVGAAQLLSLHNHATIANCTFRNNVCNRNNLNTGSSLYVAEYDGVTTDGTPSGPLFQLTLTNSTFEDNFSSSDAGGATITRCNALLEDVIFRNNSAARRAGALFMEADVGGLLVSIMEGIERRVTNGTLRRLRFEANRATTQAGALLMSGWHLELQDVVFSDNSINTFAAGGTDNAGGAVFAMQCPSALVMSDVVFEANRAYQGGAMGAELCSVRLRNAAFKGNVASGDGGAVLVTGFTSSDFTANSSVFSFETHNTTFDSNVASGMGGALKAYWSMVRAADTVFRDNNASSQGGAVYLQIVPPMPRTSGGMPVDTGERATFERCNFSRNSVNSAGGAIFHSASAIHLFDCQFYDNGADNGFFSDSWSNAGGGVFAMSCTAPMEMHRTQLVRNRADGRGGAMALLSCGATLHTCRLEANMAKLSGGGVAAGQQATSSRPEILQLSLINCTLTANTARDDDGGGLHTSSVPLLIASSSLHFNSAYQRGGGFFAGGARTLVMSDTVLQGNSAGVSGGALRAESCVVVQITNTTVASNTASDEGGGLALINTQCTRLEGLWLSGNSAAKGAGAYVAMPALQAPQPGTASACCTVAFTNREQQEGKQQQALAGWTSVRRTLAVATAGSPWVERLSEAGGRVMNHQVRNGKVFRNALCCTHALPTTY